MNFARHYLESDDALAATPRASATDVVLTEIRRAAIIYPVIALGAFLTALAAGFAYPEITRPVVTTATPPGVFDPSRGPDCDPRTDQACLPISTMPDSPNGPVRTIPRLSGSQERMG